MDFKEAAEKLKKQGHKIFSVVGDKGFAARVDDEYSYTADQVIFLVENGLKPGTPIWSRVVLNSDVPEMQATGLMGHVVQAYQNANLPKDVEIYRAPATGGIIYYFSPEAARLLPVGVSATPCVRPDFSNMKKLIL